ncbi:MAG: 50S ribosomal protein L24 [Anaerolineae bacterium]|nr:50S ribosomal protein L24 [Anaerolineae bacterium]
MVRRIKQGDTVEVVTGDSKGMRGEVMRVLPKQNRVVVSRVNIVKKHQRPIRAGRGEVQPGIIEFEMPIHISNVMLVCSACGKPTRVGFSEESGTKVRVCKKCGKELD